MQGFYIHFSKDRRDRPHARRVRLAIFHHQLRKYAIAFGKSMEEIASAFQRFGAYSPSFDQLAEELKSIKIQEIDWDEHPAVNHPKRQHDNVGRHGRNQYRNPRSNQTHLKFKTQHRG